MAEVQPACGPNEERHLKNRGNRKAAPASKPETEIAGGMIAAEEREKYEENDEGAGFKKCNPEQPLVLQHDAPPPGLKMPPLRCSSCRKLLGERRKAREVDPVLTLTRYFLTGQGRAHLRVLSLIMSRGADPGGRRKHTGCRRRRSNSRSGFHDARIEGLSLHGGAQRARRSGANQTRSA